MWHAIAVGVVCRCASTLAAIFQRLQEPSLLSFAHHWCATSGAITRAFAPSWFAKNSMLLHLPVAVSVWLQHAAIWCACTSTLTGVQLGISSLSRAAVRACITYRLLIAYVLSVIVLNLAAAWSCMETT
jgi:hypothetical protein